MTGRRGETEPDAGGRTAFYRLTEPPREAIDLPEGYEWEAFAPTPLRLRHPADRHPPPLPMYLFWYLFSVRRYRVFYIFHQGQLVHASHLLWRNPRLAFMGREDVHIGPCWTHPEHRGRRLFPAAIGRIAGLFPDRHVWMIADETNQPSRKGIERAGFRFVGYGRKTAGSYAIDRVGSA